MTRFTLAALLAASLAGPWGGCERDPVTPAAPPAVPPSERTPSNTAEPAEPRGDDGTVLGPSTRRLA